MTNYIAQWAHLYIVHFGAWVTFCIGVTIHKFGIPTTGKRIWDMFRHAMMVAALASLFSSHSHHYFKNVVPETKILHEDKSH